MCVISIILPSKQKQIKMVLPHDGYHFDCTSLNQRKTEIIIDRRLFYIEEETPTPSDPMSRKKGRGGKRNTETSGGEI